MSAINDSIQAKGRLNIVVTGPDGKVKQDLLVPNLVVMYGKNYIARRMQATPTAMGWMGIGQVSDSYGLNSAATSWGTATGTLSIPTGNGNTQAANTAQRTLGAEIVAERVSTTINAVTPQTAATYVTTTYAASTSSATNLVVNSGTGIKAGMYIHHPAIPTLAKVGASYVSGTSIPLDYSATTGPATTSNAFAINAPVSAGGGTGTVTGVNGTYVLTMTSTTGIQVGMRVTGTNIGLNAYVYNVPNSTTVHVTSANTGTVNITSGVVFDNPIYFTNENTVTYQSTFLPTATGGGGTGTNLAGAIVEAGIFNESTASGTSNSDSAVGGLMLCRTVFPVVNKGVDDTMTITWTVTIQ